MSEKAQTQAVDEPQILRERVEELTTENRRLREELANSGEGGKGKLRESVMLSDRLLSSVGDGVWAASADGSTALYVNPALERIYGRSAAEFYANPDLWFVVIHPDDQPRAERAARELLERKAAQVEYRIVRPDGEIRWILDRKSVVTDEGKRIGIGGIVADVTERKSVEESLRISEERFDLAVRGSSDALWDWDLFTGRKWCSSLFYELLGYEAGEIDPDVSHSEYLLHPEDGDRVARALSTHLEERTPYDVEYRLRKKSGEYCWIRARGQALWNAAGEPVRMAGSIRNITDRRQAEEALRISESRLRLALDALNGGVWDWNVRTGETYYTASWARMLGYEPDEIEGHVRAWENALHPDDRPAVMQALNDYFEGRSPHYSEHRMRTKSGEWIWVLDQGQIIERDEDGDPLRMTGTAVDITDRKHAEIEHKKIQARIQQAQKLESLGLLAGGIAHDFNNILTGILGNAELASESVEPSSRAQRYLERVQESSVRAADLCQQLLAYSGKGRFHVKAIDLSELSREMIQLLEVSISKNASLHFDLADGLPAIEADVNQARQVVMNLITNASEALGEVGGTISIRTGVAEPREDRSILPFDGSSANGAYVFLEVSDTGCGMDEETQRRVFDPFFSTKFTGRGLGLAAIQGIVRAHGAAIELSSRPGHGSTFRVLFPPSARTGSSIAAKEPAADGWCGEGTILVVDDEESVRSLATSILENRGFKVLRAGDGLEALEIVRRETRDIDAVLLDLTMPRMSGLECLRELRRSRPDLKVLLSSGYNEQEVVSRLDAVSVTGFIEKPYRMATLIAKFREILA